MKVSVIVPVYNTEKYLEKCLNSLVHQTLKEIEIVVVNDGSTDGSQRIIDDFSQKHMQIKAFKKENGGLSDARNYGIDRATGEFIGFVDSDDFVELGMFEKMYELALKHRAQMVICDLEKVNEGGKSFRELPQSPQLPEKINLKDDLTIFGEMSCFACNKLFQSELFQNHRFKKGIHFEDIELIPQLLLNCEVIAKINEPFYKYFERQDSITRTHTSKGLDMFLAIEGVTQAFRRSPYNHQISELKRFQIFQGFFSYLGYVAYVKDEGLKIKMLNLLNEKMKEYGIKKWDLLYYQRFNGLYLFSLPLKKVAFYLLAILSVKLIRVF